ncbi:mitochondrial processing peptide beta subunit [Strigomonas culicis]|uniref:Mitochondrial processing peptide beta subunit n=2 Tax=Strigomonas culicis TaxID=28005 RepID=S9W4A9_9TRYP|nr:mitochondrial processing peptide beta subunit [Strigomonas culicis]|eukprot:EPY34191.1 mitochondrial processing peptide beta subunit [Strigomonas culicis]
MLRTSQLARRYVVPHNTTARDAGTARVLAHCTPIVYSSLPNGFRVATEYIKDYPFATVGVWIDAGSRFESLDNSGVAHFLEHMNFKGTKKYSKKDVEDLFEYHGAHFNAYTSRDRTAYYVKAFNKDVDKMMDVVSDLLKNGRYKVTDIELERPTILAEMREVEELVDEVLMDNLHQAAYDPTTSGLPLTILGPVDNIARRIDQAMLKDYVRTHYTGPRMCLVSSGGISPDEAHAMAERFFGDLPAANHRPPLHGQYRGGHTVMWNETMATANTAVAFPICGASHPDSYPLQLLHNVLGQVREGQMLPFGHQRRNPSIPWERVPNLVQLRPFYTPYEETALLGYQIVTARLSPSNSREDSHFARDDGQTIMLNYVLSSLYDLCSARVDEDLLSQAKSEYKASVMMMRDSTTNSAEDLGRQIIHFGRRVPLEEVFECVDAVTPNSLRDAAAKYLTTVQPTVSCIGASSALPRYDPLLATSLEVRPQLKVNAVPTDARSALL